MIIRARPRVWELITFWRLSVLPQIAWQVVSVAVFSIGIVAAAGHRPVPFRNFSAAPFTLLGIALSIFLGFRNSACYERWWEARRQLGAMIGELRSLSRVALQTAGGDRERRERLVRSLIGFTYAL
ncbi:MAG: bestrophin family ion channel, partial [Janthinobacterium lividum]